ncbi:embryo defective [Thalictrum thalictroides]|uniref:Embryo defective n=1 Tax=Thalictrum thalictroides TaxID=46969 RepID=A0A7J6WX01_THATH|nr:embryo defective [Thalictrum thalictroides]
MQVEIMSIERLHNPFLGFPLKGSVTGRSYGNSAFAVRGNHGPRAYSKTVYSYQNHKKCHKLSFSQFGWRKVDILTKSSGSRSTSKMNCIEERFSQSKALVRSFVPLWKEGLLLVRCSVFVAVISALGILVWYAHRRARYYMESKILPSVCSILSEYLQRDIDCGKVRNVSPLSITLESSSIGPYHEEFSCGEVPKMKIRVRPFLSLKRGKVVIDAVLSRPTVMIVQKEDFTWLGIPPSDVPLQRHSSTEEGIDYRTKTRRLAREAMAACWAKERDSEARASAEKGYIILQQGVISSVDEEGVNLHNDIVTSDSSYCFEEQMHLGDHHCIDTGVDHRLKHAELEKSFVSKSSGSGFKLWSRMIAGSIRHGFKRKSNGKESSIADCSAKKRILELSAAAAVAHFRGRSSWKLRNPSQWDVPYSDGSHDVARCETLPVKSESASNSTIESNGDHMASGNLYVPCHMIGKQYFEQQIADTAVGYTRNKGQVNSSNDVGKNIGNGDSAEVDLTTVDTDNNGHLKSFSFAQESCQNKESLKKIADDQPHSGVGLSDSRQIDSCNIIRGDSNGDHVNGNSDLRPSCNNLQNQITESLDDKSESCSGSTSHDMSSIKGKPWLVMHHSVRMWPLSFTPGLPFFPRSAGELLFDYFSGQIQKVKSCMNLKLDDLVAELAEEVDVQPEGIEKMLPVTLDSVYFTGGTLMLLGYGDREPREMDNVEGHVKFQNHYSRVHVQLSGNCKEWRSDGTGKDGGWLSTDVVVDCIEQQWRANLKISNFFVPLFERILDIPIMWSKGRASGEIHICMSRGETFPNLHGQLDVKGMGFQIFDSPSCFSEMAASLCFRGQRIFLHNASGWFGDVPLEASGDFGINPEDGEYHLMCQVPCVEVNSLMKTFKMKPLLFPLAGSITAVFNCQGPLDAPVFVGSGVVSRKTVHSDSNFPASSASEAMMKSKEAGAVAAFDRIPFSYVSANFTFNTDNDVADLYGIRATLLDGGEIRGAGNAWICPEGEVDEAAMDVNFSGNLAFDKVMYRYVPGEVQLMPFKLGELNGETKLSGSLLKPRFDIKWAAPKAEGSFSDARGDIIISHDSIMVNSSAIAFDLYMKVQTSYPDEYWLNKEDVDVKIAVPLTVEGVELDLRMRGFEFFSLASSYSLDSPRPMHLKTTGRVKFQGKVVNNSGTTDMGVVNPDILGMHKIDYQKKSSLIGEIAISGIKLNQLMLAPQLLGSLSMSDENIKFVLEY